MNREGENSALAIEEPPQQHLRDDAQPPPEPKWRALLRRILTGAGALTFCIVLDFLPEASGLPFVLAVAMLSIIAASEFYRAVRKQGAEPSDVLGFLACIIFQLAAWRRGSDTLDPYLPALMALLVLVAMLVELVKPKQKPILNIGATLLGAIYCGWLLSFIVLVRGAHLIATPPIQGTTSGEWLAIMVIAVTSFNDIGALFVGNALGKRLLAPTISPKKTWEGAIGGILTAIAVAVGLGLLLNIPVFVTAPLGAILAISGLVGDLCESALKRDLGVKDFGVILPGHGGMLDRIDSILFAAPVAYYYLLIVSRFLH